MATLPFSLRVIAAGAALAVSAPFPGPAAADAARALAESPMGATLVGQVLDAQGNPVTSGFVLVFDFKGHHAKTITPVGSAAISEQGTYQLSGLEPGAKHYVGAAAPGHLVTWVTGRAGNHPWFSSPQAGATRTGAEGTTTTVKTITLQKGGRTITGKIAGHKPNDDVIAEACMHTPSPGGQYFYYGKSGVGYCYRGYVWPDGRYAIHGVSASVAQVMVASSRAARIKVVTAWGTPVGGVVKANFAALARTAPPRAKLGYAERFPTVVMRGYFAPGFKARASVESKVKAGSKVKYSYVWTDGRRIFGRKPSIKFTNDMLGKRPFLIVVSRLADRDIASNTQDDDEERPTIRELPFPGRIDMVNGPAHLLEGGSVPWGAQFTVAGPPPGWKYSYQWWCGSDDPETGRSYTTTADDGKARMTVLVRITATGPNGEKGSGNVGYPDVWITKRGYDLSKTSVAGKGVVGAQLRVVGPLAPGLGATYQWTRNSEPIAGATGLTYTVSPADRGHILSVWVKAAARDGYRALNTHVGRVIVGTVRPIIRLSVHRGPIRAYRSATVFIHVWVPGDPLPYQTGVAGNVTITAGGKTYTRTLRARRDGEIITHLPELPPGEQKIKITFTPKSKDQCAKASATFTEEVITQ